MSFHWLPRTRVSGDNAIVAKPSQRKTPPASTGTRRKSAPVQAIVNKAATLAEKQELESMAPIDGVTVTVLGNGKPSGKKADAPKAKMRCRAPRRSIAIGGRGHPHVLRAAVADRAAIGFAIVAAAAGQADSTAAIAIKRFIADSGKGQPRRGPNSTGLAAAIAFRMCMGSLLAARRHLHRASIQGRPR